MPAIYTIIAINGAVPINNSVSLKFRINKYTNKPTSKNPSLISVLTAFDAAPETWVVVNVILLINCPDWLPSKYDLGKLWSFWNSSALKSWTIPKPTFDIK